MSYSTLYKVYRTKVTRVCEFRNSWGSAPPLWGYLSQEHLGEKFNMMNEEQGRKVWNLFEDNIPLHHKMALGMTFDKCYLPMSVAKRALPFFQLVHDEIILRTEFEWSHWEAIGRAIRLSLKRKDKRCFGFALGCTSVCDPWEAYPDGEIYPLFEDSPAP